MKLGTWPFAWTRNRLIAAVAVATVGGLALVLAVGVRIGQSSAPKPLPEPVEEVPPYPAENAELLPEDYRKQVDFLARSAMIAVFFHETGHMLISELDLPATGPEEDAVDEFATFFLTSQLKAAPENEKAVYAAIVHAGALFWKLSAARSDITQFPFYDEHAPYERRYYNILCIATGADPLRFIPMAVKDGVPENRLVECAREYKKKYAAWESLIKPHLRGKLGGRFHKGGRMTLKIGPVEKSEWLPFELTYRQGGFFQTMLDELSDAYNLPDDITVIPKSCGGTVNAWWSEDTKSITLCHDMFANVVQVFADAAIAQLRQEGRLVADGGNPPPNQPPQPQPVPQPQPQPQPQPTPPLPAGGQGAGAAALVGQWRCQGSNPNMGVSMEELTSLTPDGAFTSQLAYSNGVQMNVWGRWSVPAANTLRYDIAGVYPQQICNSSGCMPNSVPSPVIVPFQMPQQGMLQTQNATCRKVG